MGAIAQIKTASNIDFAASVLKTTSATVGADRTWDPQGFVLPGVARWVDRQGGILIGYPQLTLSTRLPTKASRIFKVVAKVVIPTLEVTAPSTASGIQPQPTKAYDCTCVMEWMLPERSTSAERVALLDVVRSLLLGTVQASDGVPSDSTASPLSGAIANLDSPY